MTVLLQDNPTIRKAHETYKAFTANEKMMGAALLREMWQHDMPPRSPA
jgi:hypothetical protein